MRPLRVIKVENGIPVKALDRPDGVIKGSLKKRHRVTAIVEAVKSDKERNQELMDEAKLETIKEIQDNWAISIAPWHSHEIKSRSTVKIIYGKCPKGVINPAYGKVVVKSYVAKNGISVTIFRSLPIVLKKPIERNNNSDTAAIIIEALYAHYMNPDGSPYGENSSALYILSHILRYYRIYNKEVFDLIILHIIAYEDTFFRFNEDEFREMTKNHSIVIL